MLKVATQLKDNLSEQLKLYKYMDKLTAEKREIIIKGDAESLSEMDKVIEAVACQILELEQNRLSVLEGYVSRESSLSEFIKKLDPEISTALSDIREQLIGVMQNIQKMNKQNIYLIDNSIKWIEHSIMTIANVISPESAAYNQKGKALTSSTYNISSSGMIEHEA
jgi:flagellar biosynthesis/type III secretory pathway chaperone